MGDNETRPGIDRLECRRKGEVGEVTIVTEKEEENKGRVRRGKRTKGARLSRNGMRVAFTLSQKIKMSMRCHFKQSGRRDSPKLKTW